MSVDTDGGEHGLVKRVTVHANAPWTATISDHRSVPTAEAGKEASGKGDAVPRLPEGVALIRFTAKTRGSVGLWVMSPENRDLILNQIGDLQVELDVGAVLSGHPEAGCPRRRHR